MGLIRILLIADTHLGFDLPFRPRIKRRRRGPDFFANFTRALMPALRGEVDAVVHGGDVLYRSKVPARLVEMAFEPLNAPVFYPGSIERTSFAEKNEPKGYLILEFEASGTAAGTLRNWTFHELPARPMSQLDLHAAAMNGRQIQSWIQFRLYEIPADSVVKLKVHGKISAEALAVIRAPALRALAPKTMNIDATLVDYRYYRNRR